mmetsp:Transcript_138106/g.429293  ORF Transcript_138106/g.429293 Transcript_138106/m.429293 type:complete len:273 (-) Transcript_138106:1145-1963(-)
MSNYAPRNLCPKPSEMLLQQRIRVACDAEAGQGDATQPSMRASTTQTSARMQSNLGLKPAKDDPAHLLQSCGLGSKRCSWACWCGPWSQFQKADEGRCGASREPKYSSAACPHRPTAALKSGDERCSRVQASKQQLKHATRARMPVHAHSRRHALRPRCHGSWPACGRASERDSTSLPRGTGRCRRCSHRRPPRTPHPEGTPRRPCTGGHSSGLPLGCGGCTAALRRCPPGCPRGNDRARRTSGRRRRPPRPGASPPSRRSDKAVPRSGPTA